MRKFPLLTLLCIFLASAFACSAEGPAPQTDITSLRILGIRAEPPDALPGAEIKLTALAVSPGGEAISLKWLGCTSPSEANRGCLENTKATPLGEESQATMIAPKTYIPENASLLDQFRGRYLPVTLTAKTEKETESATKRIVVTKFPTNKNPEIIELTLKKLNSTTALSEPWEVKAGETYRLTPKASEESRQKYPGLDQSGKILTLTEGLFYSWYATSGTLQGGRGSSEDTPHKDWKAPSPAPKDGKAQIFLILRDGRGGTHWLTRTLTVR